MHIACAAHGHAGMARVHGAGAARERGPRPHGRSPARPRLARRARPSSAGKRSARRGASARDAHGGAVNGGGTAWLLHGGALTGAQEMAGETWQGSPAHGRWRGTTA
jgi:hypothetical protein